MQHSKIRAYARICDAMAAGKLSAYATIISASSEAEYEGDRNMITEYPVQRYEHVSDKTFEALVSAFEAVVGDADDGRLTNGLRAVSERDGWEGYCRSLFGSSGFMHVL